MQTELLTKDERQAPADVLRKDGGEAIVLGGDRGATITERTLR